MRYLVVLATLLVLTPLPARASGPDVVVAGSGGPEQGPCLVVAGAANHVSGRSRWNISYWPDTAPTTEGACPEDEDHLHLQVLCADLAPAEGPTERILHLAAGDRGTVYAITVVDGGPLGPDALGVATTADASGPKCGAENVPTEPVDHGAFVLAGA